MSEKEYIEREAAIAVIEEKQKELCPVGMYSRHYVYGSDREKFDAWQEIIDTLEEIPAADVRPVVLCKDCKHNKGARAWRFLDLEDVTADCSAGHGYPPMDWFCADGEKKVEDETT